MDEQSGLERVGLVIKNCSIIEYEDDLHCGCAMTAEQARLLAGALNHYADRVDE